MIGVERIRDFYFAISISIEIGYRAYQPSEYIFVFTFIEANVFVTHEDTQNTHTCMQHSNFPDMNLMESLSDLDAFDFANWMRKEMVIQQNDKHAYMWVEIDVEFVMDNIIIYEMWRLERIFKTALRFIWYYWAASVSYFCDLIWNVAKFKFQSMFRIITYCSL